MATQRSEERVCAGLGLLQEAPLKFETCLDVKQGGVLCGLPALLAIGLLKRTRETLPWAKGYYPQESIFLAVAFMALAGVRSMEQLRYQSPGEWGKILGLDRLPEVKTLREKIALLTSDPQRSAQWSAALARDWMATTENPGFYYIDGHVRVYHGHLAKRPKSYVAREKLCLRATMDYWVNAMDGRPFFMVTQDVDQGLAQTLEQNLLPQLLADVPHQPTEQQLQQNPLWHRFVIVFDREGFVLDLFKRLEEKRIAVITYAKFPGEDWPVEEFTDREVVLVNGDKAILSMAERGTCLANDHWVREVRHRDQRGHQTSIYATDYIHGLDKVAAALFARWCQENFFKYMIQHYALDRLVEYGSEPIPDTTLVVNPAWRKLENQIRKERNLLKKEQAQFSATTLSAEHEGKKAAAYEIKKGELLQSIAQRQTQLQQWVQERKLIPYHVPLKDIPENERFTKLPSVAKHFVDTIKLVSYRAETALVHIVREKMEREDDARALVRQIFQSSINLIPHLQNNTLTVQIHPLTSQAHTQVLEHLCQELTATETEYPRTNLKLVFECLGSG